MDGVVAKVVIKDNPQKKGNGGVFGMIHDNPLSTIAGAGLGGFLGLKLTDSAVGGIAGAVGVGFAGAAIASVVNSNIPPHNQRLIIMFLTPCGHQHSTEKRPIGIIQQSYISI